MAARCTGSAAHGRTGRPQKAQPGSARSAGAPAACVALVAALVGCGGEIDAVGAAFGIQRAERAFPNRSGPLARKLIRLNDRSYEQLTCQRIDGFDVMEGDILLRGSPRHPGSRSAGQRGAFGAGVPRFLRWPGGVIPFRPPPGTMPSSQRRDIRRAMRMWARLTKVRFVRRERQEDFVFFKPWQGCGSYVGRIGGAQPVLLHSLCSRGAILHELGHAIGLYHEQSRTDRGQHVRIRWRNIQAGQRYNFRTYEARGLPGRDIGRYAVRSVMHYGSYYFSKNGRPTIVRLGGGLITPNRSKPVKRDILAVNRMYRRR